MSAFGTSTGTVLHWPCGYVAYLTARSEPYGGGDGLLAEKG